MGNSILTHKPNRYEQAYDAACEEIRSRYPDDDHITDDEFWAMYHEMNEAWFKHMPHTSEEWLECFGDFPCLHCEHYVGISNCGEVTCKDITIYVPRGTLSEKHVTHVMRTGATFWTESPSGKKVANCEDFKKAKGQTKLAI